MARQRQAASQQTSSRRAGLRLPSLPVLITIGIIIWIAYIMWKTPVAAKSSTNHSAQSAWVDDMDKQIQAELDKPSSDKPMFGIDLGTWRWMPND
jgi:hypothetical protein